MKSLPEQEPYKRYRLRIPALPNYMEDPEMLGGDVESVLGPGLQKQADNLIIFLSSIRSEAAYARKSLIESLVAMDAYRNAEGEKEQLSTDEKLLRAVLFYDQRRERLSFCIRRSRDIVSSVYSLWEYTAQVLRNVHELDIPFRQVTLPTVLRAVYDDVRFGGLVAHTEFVKKDDDYYFFKSGSVLDRLGKYRHPSTHILDFSTSSAEMDMDGVASDDEIRTYGMAIHDFMTGKDMRFEVPHPDDLLGFAEKAYRHYLDGYGIMRRVVSDEVTELNRKLDAEQ